MRETRLPLDRDPAGIWSTTVPQAAPGTHYGFRADGPFAPEHGHRFDPSKLLVDPYAVALDRPFAYNPRLAAPRDAAIDTAPLMPKAIVTAPPAATEPLPPVFRPGGLVYEVPVRPFTILHPEVPAAIRGTVAALAHPAVLDHLTRLGVDAVELMPIAAWIDERHLLPLGLTNGWGYNPVAFMAPDPRLCPGGLPELAATVAALRAAGIGTILDVVFNHTAESDAFGPTLSLRGLDNAAYFRHARRRHPRQRRRHRQHARLRPPGDPPPRSSTACAPSPAPASTASASTSPRSSAAAPPASILTPRSSPRSRPTRSSPPAS